MGATLTFLLTDIEGSTRLWQEHPEPMARALARHDELLATTIADGGGRVFKHTGDGLCAVFCDAAAALRAAVAVQRAVGNERWLDLPALRVRVALHSGTAQLREGDYFGPTLSRASRVLGVGHGGQILATGATMGLVPGMSALDLGLHRLRDLTEPLRLFQVEAPDLAHSFPPLRSLAPFRHNLPVQRSSFIGREREMAQVRAFLARTRLLTVAGVGGCGKTRLALAVAAQEIDRFPDGAFFVDLSVLSDPSLVWNAVADALRVTGPNAGAASIGAQEAVLGYVSQRSVLILLDNCEHVVEECAELVDALLGRCASVVVLATSREPLAVEGEQVFRVPSLGLPQADGDVSGAESVRLFVDRAMAADASFALLPETTATVAEICRRLDGMPLAIELVAPRVRHLALAEIVRRLDQRFLLLTGGRRDARHRQQTLQAAIDWSHELLRGGERVLLRRAAVFVDGFTLEAAQGVCTGDDLPPEDVVDALTALVDKSLVSLHAAEGRYRLLESIRLYAQARLGEAHEAEAVQGRHAAWFLRLGEQATAGRWWQESNLPAAELENFRAAQVWSHEVGDGDRVARLNLVRFKSRFGVLSTAGSVEEARRWGDIALAYDELAPELRADNLAIASWRDIGAGDWAQAEERARMAIRTAPQGSARLLPVAYWALSTALMVRDPDAADRILDEGIERFRYAQEPVPIESLLSFKIDVALTRGELERALAIGRQVDAAAQALLLRHIQVSFALHLLGRHAEAEEDVRARLVRSGGEEDSMYHAHLLLALTYAARGRCREADDHLGEAAKIVRRDRYPLTLNDCVMACGALAALEGDLARAATLLACAIDGRAVRSPAMFAVYRHYRSIVREGLDPDTIRRCREKGRALDPVGVLDEEVARRSMRG